MPTVESPRQIATPSSLLGSTNRDFSWIFSFPVGPKSAVESALERVWPPKRYVRQAFRKYLECGIFAHGFARACCDDCGHDYLVAFSCKGQGVCPEATALLHAARRGSAQHGAAYFPAGHRAKPAIQQPWCGDVDKATLHVGAFAFIHRFGSSPNGYEHFYGCPGPLARKVDGVAGNHWTSLKRVFAAVGFRCVLGLRLCRVKDWNGSVVDHGGWVGRFSRAISALDPLRSFTWLNRKSSPQRERSITKNDGIPDPGQEPPLGVA